MNTPTPPAPKPKRKRTSTAAPVAPAPAAPPPPLPKPREPIEVRIQRLQEAKQKADAPPPAGLVCPRCGCGHFFVVYVRQRVLTIVRRRECRNCRRRITTRERVT